MNRYVKISGHSNWFMFLSQEDDITKSFSDSMSRRIIEKQAFEYFNDKRKDSKERLLFAIDNPPNYKKLVDKYGKILIRQNGSFMLCDEEKIIEEVFDIDFPFEFNFI